MMALRRKSSVRLELRQGSEPVCRCRRSIGSPGFDASCIGFAVAGPATAELPGVGFRLGRSRVPSSRTGWRYKTLVPGRVPDSKHQVRSRLLGKRIARRIRPCHQCSIRRGHRFEARCRSAFALRRSGGRSAGDILRTLLGAVGPSSEVDVDDDSRLWSARPEVSHGWHRRRSQGGPSTSAAQTRTSDAPPIAETRASFLLGRRPFRRSFMTSRLPEPKTSRPLRTEEHRDPDVSRQSGPLHTSATRPVRPWTYVYGYGPASALDRLSRRVEQLSTVVPQTTRPVVVGSLSTQSTWLVERRPWET